MSARIYLKVAREKSLRRKHPWIFSQAINKIKGNPLLGDTVDVYDLSLIHISEPTRPY